MRFLTSSIGLSTIFAWALMISQMAHAQTTIAEIPLPETTQLKNALFAAARTEDVPLSPAEIGVPAELVNIKEEEPSVIEQTISESLEPITLEEQIQNQVLQSEIDQFGYDIFSIVPTTFAPVESIPVPPDYQIGPGDTFLIKIYGAVDVEYRLVVTREGKLLLPEVGEVQVAGLQFDEAKLVLSEEISNARVGARAVVTLADLHTIQILMVGEVSRPGSYTISGLSSLLNTLITTGGIKRSGSLRNIQVRRAGKVVSTMDLYQLLLNGFDQSNIYLRMGDVVFVPPIGPTVGIIGEINRPAIYEIKDEKTVQEIIDMSGGIQATAALQKTHIERISDAGSKTLVALDSPAKIAKTNIKNGDLIRVFPVLNKMDGVVLLGGHVIEPGGFEWYNGLRISQLLANSDVIRQRTDFSVGLIVRENNHTKRIHSKYFSLKDALNHPASALDPILEPRDQVMIFDTNSNRSEILEPVIKKMRAQSTHDSPPMTYDVLGAVRHSGTYPLQTGQTLLDSLKIAGNLPEGYDPLYSLLVRKNRSNNTTDFIHISLGQALENPGGDHNPIIMPEDRIYIFDDKINRSELISKDVQKLRDQATYESEAKIVNISGTSRFNGTYPLTPGMRLKDLIAASGGMKHDTYGFSANLSRRSEIDDEFSTVDHYEVSLTHNELDHYDLDLILQPSDFLVLKEKPEYIYKPKLVTIEGEVLYPGTYQVDKFETMCALIRRAGGFTEDAYLFGSVFTRESVRRREQEALDRMFNELDDRLVDVHLSPGFNKDNKLPALQGTTDTYRVIQNLKKEKAAGRLVVDIEKAVNKCYENEDFVLEDGDKLFVPKFKEEVSVAGQVYYPSSHMFREDRAALDYINLSGGMREFAQHEHVFVVQANGEVMTIRSPLSTWGWALQPKNLKVTPGSTVFVPISLDRINGREFAQTWTDLIYKLSISAASLDFLFN